ncbi:MAG: MBL fold metallo-hydrolase [Candidatus Shapirobacteria bacterium]|nr:MBL fold metallo-hydrolase [Candidatus Shapirobacteria bacterium]
MLEDSVKIQESDKEKKPLYNRKDVNDILKRVKIIEAFEEIDIGSRHGKITAILIPNGHMNGSVSVLIKDGVTKKNTLFTGDIGRPNQLTCGGYNEYSSKYPDCRIHTILTESTCFEKDPVSFSEREINIFNAVTKTAQRGGVSVMPLIAGRLAPTMEIFHNDQECRGQFLDYHFYMDAPLPRKVLKVHQDLGPDYMSNWYGDDPCFYKTKENSMSRFNIKNLTIVESHEQSKLLVEHLAYSSEKAIVFASGGMVTRGRSVNYRSGKFNQNPNNSFILTCFQVPGTRGAEMIKEIENGKVERKTAEVIWADGNSSHASGHELIDFYKRFNLNSLENFILGHGREPARETGSREIQKEDFAEYTSIFLPKLRQIVAIG